MATLRNSLIDMYQGYINLANTEKPSGYKFKIINYNKAIAALRRYKGDIKKIKNVEQAFLDAGLKNPTRLLEKAQQLFDGDNPFAQEQEKIDALTLFTSIPYIGLAGAKGLYEQGYKTIKELKEKVKKDEGFLNSAQRIGVLYYKYLVDPKTLHQKRVPRKEIECFDLIITSIVNELNSKARVIVVGSYRRGLLDSGDIDILIDRPLTKKLLKKLI